MRGFAAALVLATAVSSAGGGNELKPGLDELVGSERAFARIAIDKGIRPAFLQYLAAKAVVFRPGPVDGRGWYSERTDISGTLIWEPEFAEIARSADMGYTTGPWEFKEKTDQKDPDACGHYVSIWSRQPDGSWLVLVDVGNTHGRHDRPVSAGRTVTTRGEGPIATAEEMAKIDTVAETAVLMKMDADLAAMSLAKGALEAYLAVAADDIRVYRKGAEPTVGLEAMRRVLPARPATLTWAPVAGGVSRSGDLGFTYGSATLKPGPDASGAAQFSYLRIWRRGQNGDWRIALDLHSPMPPAAAKPAS